MIMLSKLRIDAPEKWAVEWMGSNGNLNHRHFTTADAAAAFMVKLARDRQRRVKDGEVCDGH